MKLLIVESPAKCKKIQGYLGAGWRVQATMGHIRALAEDLKAIGFDGSISPAWAPTYEAIAAKKDAIASLRREAKGAEVYLGSDDDREGEAIAWHTCVTLGLDPATTPRVTFHEITESALKAAVAAPGRIDMPKFYAQQARTMLDMLIGFTLSPCLWRGVGYKPGLSAGRCQTPALRIIYDRDQLIGTHVSTTNWVLSATSEHDLTWTGVEECTENTNEATLRKLTPAPHTLVIKDRQERISTSQAPAPFITSSLQQEASSRLSMNPKVTMRCAQTLYEAGHITYMRTDNPVLSAEAKDAAIAVVLEKWGATYVGGEPVKKVVKKKASKASEKPETGKPEAQAAHEGIRPTHMETTEVEGVQEQRLYTLIWNRTLQSVMAPETRDVVTLKATPTADPTLLLTTEWDQTRFAGWRILDAERKAEEEGVAAAAYTARKPLVASNILKWLTFTVTESPTTPPSRYKEAALIRELEHKGIGRPSTYATLVETVLERGYVEKATTPASPVTLKGWLLTAGATAPTKTTKVKQMGGERDILRTTALGRTVIEWLLTTFGDMLDYGFTAAMEQQLDEVAKGAKPWAALLTDTWSRYRETYTSVMSAPTASGSTVRANVADFGDGYKMVVSRKGPLFVLETPDAKTRFAPVPASLSLQTATRADAEAAFAATDGETLGTHEGSPVIRKKGPYGPYVTCGATRINCTATETFAEICLRLTTKTAAAPGDVNHVVGPYHIKKGPYGLYMFKATTGSKKPTFVGIPETTPWSTLTVEGAETLYKYSLENKSKVPAAKWKSKAKDSPGH